MNQGSLIFAVIILVAAVCAISLSHHPAAWLIGLVASIPTYAAIAGAPATIVDPSANLRPGQILDRCTLCDAVILTLSAANGEESPHFRSSDIGYIRCETALSSSHEAAERKWTGKQIRPSRGSAWEWKERGPPVTASDLAARNMAARERETSTGCPKWNRKREALERLAVPILVFFFYRPHWLSRYDSIVGLASMGTMVSRIASGCAICSPSAVGEILVR